MKLVATLALFSDCAALRTRSTPQGAETGARGARRGRGRRADCKLSRAEVCFRQEKSRLLAAQPSDAMRTHTSVAHAGHVGRPRVVRASFCSPPAATSSPRGRRFFRGTRSHGPVLTLANPDAAAVSGHVGLQPLLLSILKLQAINQKDKAMPGRLLHSHGHDVPAPLRPGPERHGRRRGPGRLHRDLRLAHAKPSATSRAVTRNADHRRAAGGASPTDSAPRKGTGAAAAPPLIRNQHVSNSFHASPRRLSTPA